MCPEEHAGSERGITGAGRQVGLIAPQRRMGMYCLGDLGFPACFCGDGNRAGSLINCGLSRKLLFQSLFFLLLFLPGLMSLCVIDHLGKGVGMLCLYGQVLILLVFFSCIAALMYLCHCIIRRV